MKKSKYIIFSTLFLFGLMFLTHFGYDVFPNFFTSLFFPVNESIMEHMKMIYTTYLIFYIILYFYKKNKFKNYPSSFLLTSIFNIVLFLAVYLPLFNILGENMIITFITLFLSILASSFVSYKLLTAKDNYTLNTLSIIVGIVVFIVFGLLTYNPIEYYLWYDFQDNYYGIK